MRNDILILNVDDNEVGRYSKTRMLRFLGYKVIEADSGLAAMEQLSKEDPDLVLLDVNLPDISGYEVCKRIKNDRSISHIPVVMTSAAFIRGADRARGLEGGAEVYMVEPLGPEIMQATINSVLRTKQAEKRTHTAIRQWEATFSSISDAIALLDTDGKIIRTNEKFKEVADIHVAAEGKTLEEWLDAVGVNGGGDISTLMVEAQNNHLELCFGEHWIDLKVDTIIEEGEGPTGYIAILADITERKASEAALREARDLAQNANAAKDRFLAALSHELRTPLTPVLMFVDFMRYDDSVSAELKLGLEMIHRNIMLEARLIDDLLDLTRIAHGKLHVKIEPVDLQQLVGHAIEITAGEVLDKQIDLSVELAAEKPIVSGDAARLQQVFWNLIKNAVKFTPAKGTIRIVADNPTPDRIRVAVTDSGIGMPVDALSKVFEPFEQADASITKRFGGLGLGLAISRSIVEIHEGTLTAHSGGEGMGSTFEVTFATTNGKQN